ncbi:MAG: contractile injection system protein, VgrG/Pvc8 family [Pseudomonadota bacterium]
MRPAWQLIADGTDLTAALSNRLERLSLVDEKGEQSDQLEIVISDPNAVLDPPRKGVELALSLGYGSDLVGLGHFTVDEVQLSGPPDQFRIIARAADFLSGLKARKTRGWPETTLGDLLDAIAAEHGLTPAIDQDLSTVAYAHIDQTESDLNLLTRLARDHGAIAKPVDRHLVMTRRGTGETISGAPLPTQLIPQSDMLSWRLVQAERPQFAGASARFFDPISGEESVARAVDGDGPIKALPRLYDTQETALAAARAAQAAMQRGRERFEATLVGRPDLQAESPLSVSHRRSALNGDWITTRAEHRFDRGGYTTLVRAERRAD